MFRAIRNIFTPAAAVDHQMTDRFKKSTPRLLPGRFLSGHHRGGDGLRVKIGLIRQSGRAYTSLIMLRKDSTG